MKLDTEKLSEVVPLKHDPPEIRESWDEKFQERQREQRKALYHLRHSRVAREVEMKGISMNTKAVCSHELPINLHDLHNIGILAH
eukprot:scaffold926_cov408-Prasinococcus_capsulatus_cf.AAC.46